MKFMSGAAARTSSYKINRRERLQEQWGKAIGKNATAIRKHRCTGNHRIRIVRIHRGTGGVVKEKY